MPLFIFARFHAGPSLQDALLRALSEIVKPSRTEPGCRSLHLFRSVQDPALFFIHSEWAAVEDFDAHAELPHMIKFLRLVPDLIDHPLDVNRTQIIA